MQHFIYIRSARLKYPCTEEEFKDYYRDINTFRRKEQRHGRCMCPKSHRLACDMVCGHCQFICQGDMLSLDDEFHIANETDDYSYAHLVNMSDSDYLLDDFVIDGECLKAILKRIEELMPMAILIGRLRIAGYTETEIEQLLHIGRRTYAYRLKKLRGIIEKEFSEILQDFFQIRDF